MLSLSGKINTHSQQNLLGDVMIVLHDFVLLPTVLTRTHHQGCVRAIPLLCKVSGRSDTWGATAEAAVRPHPVQCCHLDPHPCQGELLQVTRPMNEGQVPLHVIRLEWLHIGSFQTPKAPVICGVIIASAKMRFETASLHLCPCSKGNKGENVACCEVCITPVYK